MIRELNSVIDGVDKYLVQPLWVGIDRWAVWRNVCFDLQAFHDGARLEDLEYRLERLRCIHSFTLQWELARLDSRQIEQIADELRQMLSIAVRDFEKLALLFR